MKKLRNRLSDYAKLGFVLALLFGTFSSCGRESQDSGPRFGTKPTTSGVLEYRLAVYALYNPAKLIQVYQPLVDQLNNALHGVHISLETSRNYADFEDKYRTRKCEIVLPNAWQTLQALKAGYRVIAKTGKVQDLKGIFVVRKDGVVKLPADLKGKAISYPSPTAMAACIMPQYFLYEHGVDINSDIENHYVGSQESSIMNVYLGLTAAAATWPPPWRTFQKEHPKEATELKVIWETEPLINSSVMVRDDVPAQIAEQIRAILIGLSGTGEGDRVLDGMETARFVTASDADYDVVRRFISDFERDVRPVEQR